MVKVYACIAQDHDPRLLCLATLICFLGAITSTNLAWRAGDGKVGLRWPWLAVAAIAGGSGVWATHFLAMLGYQPGIAIGYDVGASVLSFVVAILLIGFSLWLTLAGTSRRPVLGGIVFGISVGVMHYTGMEAIAVPARVHYNPALVVASFAIGISLGAAGLHVALGRAGMVARLAGAGLLVLAIAGLHFTGMAALEITPDPLAIASVGGTPTAWIALVVAVAASTILGLSLVGSVVDQQFTRHIQEEADKLRRSEARFRQLADATFEGIAIHIDGLIIDSNRALGELLGRDVSDLVGRHVLEIIAPDSRPAALRRMEAGRLEAEEIELLHVDGSIRPVAIFTQAIDTPDGRARVVAVRDIRERIAAEQRIRHLAFHDALTELPNRRLFLERLDEAVSQAQRADRKVAVLNLDLDRFKTINDVMGHRCGDEALQEVARRLLATVRHPDTVARLSGDQFAIIAPGGPHPAGPAQLAERLIKVLADPFLVGGQQTQIGASIGVALYPEDSDRAEQLMTNAELALDRAKAAGRGTFRFFEAGMDERLVEKRRLERDLQEALGRNEFELHYQPLFACDSQRLQGFEALVRWRHPVRGLVSPADFIPIAEESGAIIPLGEWVLRTACQEAMNWPDDLKVAVNLSPLQFQRADLALSIIAILAEIGYPARRLELEVTEGVLIDDPGAALDILGALKAAGVWISLDDFGTGYSSLSYLQRFPFDKIKIDKSFVSTLENGGSMPIIRAIIALARSLEMNVTAEGVETPAQLDILRGEQCDNVQGYLLGRPVPAAQVRALLPGLLAPEETRRLSA